MTGGNISDAEALKKADVGFCMGSGNDVAKDNSDLIVLDDNFVSIHKAINWGRNIFENMRKFIVFQLTINIVVCLVMVLGGAVIGHNPFNVIQLLWINLAMDILSAIALGTEPCLKTIGDIEDKQVRISRRVKMFTLDMWRQIFCQVAY